MPDNVNTVAALLVSISVIAAALCRVYKSIIKSNVDKSLNDNNIHQMVSDVAGRLKKCEVDIEILQELSHKDNIRHAELGMAIEALAVNQKELDKDFKDMIRIFMEKVPRGG